MRETQNDNGFDLAAQLAYYFFLALFPALLFMLALVSLFPVSDLPDRLAGQLVSVAPPEVATIIGDQLAQLWLSRHGGLLTFGFLAALWSSSAALVALIDILDRVYDVEDSRPWWKQRLTAILLTLGLGAFIVASATLVLAGPELAQLVADRVGLGIARDRACGMDLESFLDAGSVEHHMSTPMFQLAQQFSELLNFGAGDPDASAGHFARETRRGKVEYQRKQRRSNYGYRSRGVRDLSRQDKFRGRARCTSRGRIPEQRRLRHPAGA